MKVFRKKNKDYSKVERGFTALFAFVAFGLIGFLVRLFSDEPISLQSTNIVAAQFASYVIGCGGLAAVFGYLFPKPMNILLMFLPTPGINS